VIDVAFLDRADVRQYIPLPSAGAVYQILYSCIQELVRVTRHCIHIITLLWRSFMVLNVMTGWPVVQNIWKH